jgi:hypothetical protein
MRIMWWKRKGYQMNKITKEIAIKLRKGDWLIPVDANDVLTVTQKPNSLTVEGLWIVSVTTNSARLGREHTVYVR